MHYKTFTLGGSLLAFAFAYGLAAWLPLATAVSPRTTQQLTTPIAASPAAPIGTLAQPVVQCAATNPAEILLCQATDEGVRGSYQPAYGNSAGAPCNGNCTTGCNNESCRRRIDGIDCEMGDGCQENRWNRWGQIPFSVFNQGEYIGPARDPHLHTYRVRVDDELEFVYVYARDISNREYQLQVGDTIKVESLIDPNINRELVIQPDGNVYLLLLGPARAANKTLPELTADLKEKYKKYYKVTDINLTPLKTNTKAEDIRAAVDSRFFSGGQGRRVKVNPEGTVSLPEIGQIYVQGLSLDEIRREVNERYNMVTRGFSITPNLAQRAPHFVFVLGEVKNPGRFTMDGPTTTMQAIALAGGWQVGGNLRQVVVFRRGDDWRLLATMLDIRGALYGKRPTPADEIFLRDSDIIVVPKNPIQATDDVAELLFTRGLYRILPISFQSSRL